MIRRMSVENPLWGAPRIHGELLKLGFEVAQSSVARKPRPDASTVDARPPSRSLLICKSMGRTDRDLRIARQACEKWTCVDAPSDASRIFSRFTACGQVLTCVRPRYAANTRRGPLWKSADQVQYAYARLMRRPFRWFSRPRLRDRLPINLLDLPISADTSSSEPQLRSRRRNLIVLTPAHHRPGDPRHLIRQCNGDQHPRLPRQHASKPRAGWRTSAGRPANHGHGANDQ